MSLLDFLNTEEGRLGLGLLAAGGPTSRPMGFGERIQSAFAGVDDYRQNQTRAKHQQLQYDQGLLSFDKAKRDNASDLAIQQAARESYRTPQAATALSTGPMPDGSAMPTVQPGFDQGAFLSRMAQIDPLKAMQLQHSMAKDNTPMSVAAGGSLVGRDGKVLFTAPEKPMELERMLNAAGITDPAQRATFLRQALQKQTTHAPGASATVHMHQEKEENKAVGKFYGDSYAEVQKAGLNAQSAMNRYSRLGQLLEGVDTGKFAPLGVEVAKTAQSLGLNVDPKLANKEAAIALSSEIALQLRNPSGGAGMPGAMSDADRNFLTGMVPGIEKTPEGRKNILETAKKLAQRDVQVAKMARDYRQKRGTIDEGFYDQLAQFSEANPLFKGAPAAPAGGATGGKAKFLGFEK